MYRNKHLLPPAEIFECEYDTGSLNKVLDGLRVFDIDFPKLNSQDMWWILVLESADVKCPQAMFCYSLFYVWNFGRFDITELCDEMDWLSNIQEER